MKISYRWLMERLGRQIPPREAVDKLIMIGHEVEGELDLGLLDNPICIARVGKVEPHPAAATEEKVKNLTLCEVDDGSGEKLSVVCGAPNVREGMVSVLAKIGARLPGDKVIEESLVRGVPSQGMLLAFDEMGLGSDHSGIVELDDDAPVGEGFDLILDMEITPNRPDCLSVLGLARDLSAAYGRKVYFHPDRLQEIFESAHSFAAVFVNCFDQCPRYTARVIRNVKVGPSPEWLKRRLLSVGLRPINNVVDVTNLVLMDLGHPLHAFDYDKLEDHKIIVRLAEEGETITLLDDSVITLRPGQDMVIADAKKPVALAGIMGGRDSEVGEETKDVLLESAYFDPPTIRQTARHHRLSTDASYRFERGADPMMVQEALDQAASLIQQVSEGKIAKGFLDSQPPKESSRNLMLRPERACKVLGIELSRTEIADLISAIGCEIVRSEGEILVVAAPSYRVDIEREEDLFEEIARLYGYNRIPATLPYFPSRSVPPNPENTLRRRVQDMLAGYGFRETIHLSFISAEQMDLLGLSPEAAPRLMNPLSRELEYMRPDLTPSMLQALIYNQNRGNGNVSLFEVGKSFHLAEAGAERPYLERRKVMLAAMGDLDQPGWENRQPEKADFFYLKGVVQDLCHRLGIDSIALQKGGPQFLHKGRRALILCKREGQAFELGWMGELSPFLREDMGFRNRPVLAELDLDVLLEVACDVRTFQDIPRHPGIERDLALILDESVPAAQVEKCIQETGGEWLESLFLFDCYSGEQVGAGKKSLGYRALYRHPERTLKDSEVDGVQKETLARLEQEVGATLRED